VARWSDESRGAGSGFVYLGRPVAALGDFDLASLSTLLWGPSGLDVAYLAMFLAVYVCVIGACVALARRQGASNLNRWQTLVLYVCFSFCRHSCTRAFSRRGRYSDTRPREWFPKSMEKTLLAGCRSDKTVARTRMRLRPAVISFFSMRPTVLERDI